MHYISSNKANMLKCTCSRQWQIKCQLTKVRSEFFYYLIYKPSYCNFPESRKKIKLNFLKLFFLFYPPNIIVFASLKTIIYFWDSVYVFCPVQIFREMMKYLDLIQTVGVYLTSVTVFSFFLEILKKIWKKSSENDQSNGHSPSLFFVPSTLNLKKIP